MTWPGGAILVVIACGACSAASVATPSSVPVRPTDSTAAPARTARAMPPAPGASDATPLTAGPRLERMEQDPAAGALPVVEIQSPFFGAVVPAARAAGTRVRLTVENGTISPTAGAIAVLLDDERPRVLHDLSVKLTLRDLIPEDRVIAPGRHRLVAAVLDSAGLAVRADGPVSRGPLAMVEFFVGERGELPDEGPFAVLLQPAGTYNGASDADAITIDCLVVGAGRGPAGDEPLELHVVGPSGDWRFPFDARTPWRLGGLSSGDHVVQVTLARHQDAGPPASRASRTITVNRDVESVPSSAGTETLLPGTGDDNGATSRSVRGRPGGAP